MLGMDNYWLVSEALLILTFIVFVITYMLIPGRKKVLEEGKALPGWAPAALITMILFAAGVGIVGFLSVEKNAIILISVVLVILAIVVTLIDYMRTKIARDSAVAAMATGTYQHQAGHAPYHPHLVQQVPTHQPHTAPVLEAVHVQEMPGQAMMTVECPNCNGHIEIPEGSHTIVCPYCGLSGTM